MKAYLFIEGETKIPTEGDWAIDVDGIIFQADMHEREEFLVLNRHEIEIPERAITFIAFPSECPINCCVKGAAFPIPRPKKKVKKWQWLCKQRHDGRYYATDPMTQGEFDDWVKCAVEVIARIDESEIEVEE